MVYNVLTTWDQGGLNSFIVISLSNKLAGYLMIRTLMYFVYYRSGFKTDEWKTNVNVWPSLGPMLLYIRIQRLLPPFFKQQRQPCLCITLHRRQCTRITIHDIIPIQVLEYLQQACRYSRQLESIPLPWQAGSLSQSHNPKFRKDSTWILLSIFHLHISITMRSSRPSHLICIQRSAWVHQSRVFWCPLQKSLLRHKYPKSRSYLSLTNLNHNFIAREIKYVVMFLTYIVPIVLIWLCCK